MNENVLSFIKWAAGIVVTLAIISIALLVFNMARVSALEGANKIGEMNTEIAESDITIYDGQEVLGSTIVNLIRRFDDDYLGIQVQTGKNRGGTWYGYNCSISSGVASVGSESSSSLSNAIDETNNNYINSYGKFDGKVYRDSNGSVVAIVFVQK